MDFVTLLIVPIGFATLGFFLGGYVKSLKSSSSNGDYAQKIASLEARLEQTLKNLEKEDQRNRELLQEKEFQGNELARMQAHMQHLETTNTEQKQEVAKLQERFTKEFENLANKILDEKSQKFTTQNKENIHNILQPLQEKIQLFEKKVEDSQKENISIHAALKEQLITLQSQNLKITQEAENLTKALKGDSKMQGNWGELVLERVLEKSGLEKDREYFVQQSFTTEQGNRLLPDVVIALPDGNKMIVDSKVSLTHYERYVNAEESEKPTHLKEHLNSLKRHIDQLSEKKYEDLYQIESPDFVLLFVPIEPAFAIAINEDPSIYSKAFEQNIVIVTPSTLLATLRTIVTMWTNEKQQKNALEIARQAGALYDKFEGFSQDLLQIGKKMDEAKGSYSAAMNKLVDGRGNLITSVEKLKKMGAKAKKSLPEALLKRSGAEDLLEE
ncbi:MAG: DNA recombination protein RmuC [Flavobacteriaceae bacterium]